VMDVDCLSVTSVVDGTGFTIIDAIAWC